MLSQFTCEIEYVPGTKIKQADFMSRCPGKLCLCDYACSDPCSEDYLTKPCEFRRPEEIVRLLQMEEEEPYDSMTDEVFCAVETDDDHSEPEEIELPNSNENYPFPWNYEIKSLNEEINDYSSLMQLGCHD